MEQQSQSSSSLVVPLTVAGALFGWLVSPLVGAALLAAAALILASRLRLAAGGGG